MLADARYRAKRKGVPCTLTLKDIYFPDKCPVFGLPLRVGKGTHTASSPTLDRIVPELGYVPGNVVVVSHKANEIKGAASPYELRRVAEYYEQLIMETDNDGDTT